MKIGEIYDEREEERSKAYDEGYQQGRADAIDEFLKKALKEYFCPFVEMDMRVVACEELKKIAKEMSESR